VWAEAVGYAGKIVDRLIPGFQTGKTILAKAKSTLSTADIISSLAKFEGTLGALGSEAQTVESLLLTYCVFRRRRSVFLPESDHYSCDSDQGDRSEATLAR
jgi:hypothetical protein